MNSNGEREWWEFAVHCDDMVETRVAIKSYKRLASTYLAVLLVEITVAGIDGVVPGCVSENKLKIGTGCRERDLRVALSTAILKTYLPFFLRSISVTRISHLQKRESTNILVSNVLIKIYQEQWESIYQDVYQRKLICEF